jgi:hypothetical protein
LPALPPPPCAGVKLTIFDSARQLTLTSEQAYQEQQAAWQAVQQAAQEEAQAAVAGAAQKGRKGKQLAARKGKKR